MMALSRALKAVKFSPNSKPQLPRAPDIPVTKAALQTFPAI